ncbi:MAG: FeoC-like transcriptional regulator [Alkalispirochaeta sp.]
MIVSAVKQQMQTRGRATLSQVAAELGESQERVAEAMQLHLDRGRVYRETIFPDGECRVTGCAHCPLVGACRVGETRDVGVEVYVWNTVGSHE